MKRALRRHNRARLKAKRKSYYGGTQASDAVAVGVWIDTPTPCSCWMCRSPRRNRGSAADRLTTQERRLLAALAVEHQDRL